VSRTNHRRPAKDERGDYVIFVRVPNEMRNALRKRLAELRKKHPFQRESMTGLVRTLLNKALDGLVSDEVES
jgi:hypothetical protein